MAIVLGLILSVLLVFTSIFLKMHFLREPLPSAISFESVVSIVAGCIFSYYAWLSLISMFLGGLVWIYLMSKAPISVVYPLASFSYVIMVFADRLFFGTPISMIKIIGVLLIVAGVFVMSRQV